MHNIIEIGSFCWMMDCMKFPHNSVLTITPALSVVTLIATSTTPFPERYLSTQMYAEFVHGLSQRIADEVQHSMIWKLLYYVNSALEPFSYSDLMALLSLSCEDELEALITWLYPIVIVEPFKQYSE